MISIEDNKVYYILTYKNDSILITVYITQSIDYIMDISFNNDIVRFTKYSFYSPMRERISLRNNIFDLIDVICYD